MYLLVGTNNKMFEWCHCNSLFKLEVVVCVYRVQKAIFCILRFGCICIDRELCIGYVSLSSFRRQQQERQGQPCVFLLWFHRVFRGPGTDRSGNAHFQGSSTRPTVFGACMSRDSDHTGSHSRRNFRAVQVSFMDIFILFFCKLQVTFMLFFGDTRFSLKAHVDT